MGHLTAGHVSGGVQSGQAEPGEQAVVFGPGGISPVRGVAGPGGVAGPAGRRGGQDARIQIISSPHHHSEHLVPGDAAKGVEGRRSLAGGDALGGAHGDEVVGVEGSVVTLDDIGEIADVVLRYRVPAGEHDHLGELLARDWGARTEVAVGIPLDDVPRRQIGDGDVVWLGGGDVEKA